MTKWCAAFEVVPSRLLIVAPPLINEEFLCEATEMFRGGGVKSQAFGRLYSLCATTYAAAFFDAATVVRASSEDGIHLDAAANRILAESLAPAIQNLVPLP
jgi:lysophospholipase L1-like esterase